MEDSLKTLVGAGAAPFYESAGYSVETWNDGLKGIIYYGEDEYLVIRHNIRSWEVKSDGRSWHFGSQWEMMEWFGDHL